MINLEVIATVANDRHDLTDDNWGAVVSRITLNDDLSEGLLLGLENFSHVEIIFVFDQKIMDHELPPTRHPRNNLEWPKIGLLAQRSVYHPNPIGHTSAKILSVEGRTLTVQGLDAVNRTPVLDIKPVFREFLPNQVEQPAWVSQLMQNYWSKA